MNRQRAFRRVVVGLLLAAILVGAVTFSAPPAAAQAQSDDPTECERSLSDLFDGEDDCIDWSAYVGGWFDRAKRGVANVIGPDENAPTAPEHADAAAAQINGHAGAYLRYLNAVDRINATESAVVVRVRFVVDDSEAVRYLVAEGNATTGEWTDLRAVDNTTLTTDIERTLEGATAENAADELATVREQDWFREGTLPSNTYVSRLAGRYGRGVLTNLVSGDGGES